MEKAQHRHDISDRAWEILEPLLCISLRDKISRQFAAALSAAVDSTKFNGDAPTIQAEPPMQKQPIQTPATLRVRGSGGEALLLEKRPLPQNLPTLRLFGREREGGGFSTEKPPPSHYFLTPTLL